MEEIKRNSDVGREWDKIRDWVDNYIDHPELRPKSETEAAFFFALLRQKVDRIKAIVDDKDKMQVR